MSKLCSRCKIEKAIDMFGKDRQKSDGFSSICKVCSRQACKNYYLRTSEPKKRNIGREGLSQRNPNAYMELWRKENVEKIKQYRDKWASKNPHSIRHKNMRRHAAKVQRTPVWLSPTQKAEIDAMYLFCQIFEGYEVDHIIPLRGKKVSGLHVPWNLQVIPASINRAKSNKLLTNWSDLCQQY